MAAQRNARSAVRIHRAPVLTLWAAVVAERLGFAWEEALTLGRAVAGLHAYAKGKALGLFRPTPNTVQAKRRAVRGADVLAVDLLHRAVPVVRTDAGLRALRNGKPINPDEVRRYLGKKFGDALEETYAAMKHLATALPPATLAKDAYHLYEQFRPTVPAGTRGWGATGVLSLDAIRKLARQER